MVDNLIASGGAPFPFLRLGWWRRRYELLRRGLFDSAIRSLLFHYWSGMVPYLLAAICALVLEGLAISVSVWVTLWLAPLLLVGLVCTSIILAQDNEFRPIGELGESLLLSVSLAFLLIMWLSEGNPPIIQNPAMFSLFLLAGAMLSIASSVAREMRISAYASAGIRRVDFMRKFETRWKELCSDDPEKENIMAAVGEAGYVLDLLDAGMFGLAVLWSCNVMEKILEETVRVCRRYAKARALKLPDLGKEPPARLVALGFRVSEARHDVLRRSLEPESLWRIRNNIAHRNHITTLDETCAAIGTLSQFLDTFDPRCDAILGVQMTRSVDGRGSISNESLP